MVASASRVIITAEIGSNWLKICSDNATGTATSYQHPMTPPPPGL
jgi:hypothetical protein